MARQRKRRKPITRYYVKASKKAGMLVDDLIQGGGKIINKGTGFITGVTKDGVMFVVRWTTKGGKVLSHFVFETVPEQAQKLELSLRRAGHKIIRRVRS